jgi:hypothetical protein
MCKSESVRIDACLRTLHSNYIIQGFKSQQNSITFTADTCG